MPFTYKSTVLASDPWIVDQFLYESRKLMKVGSDRYVVGVRNDRTKFIVMKSTDGGTTWTGPLDDANSPTSSISVQARTIVVDPSHGKIHFLAALVAAGTCQITYFIFDLATQRYSSPVNTSSTSRGNSISAAVQSDGSLLVINSNYTGTQLDVATISGGAWGGFSSLIPPTTGHTFWSYGLLIDSGGTAHIAFQDNHIPFTTTVSKFRYVTWNGGAGAPADIYAPGIAENFTLGPGVIWNDCLLWARCKLLISSQAVELFVGTPVSAPVWTRYTVATLTGYPFNDRDADIVVSDGTPWIVWGDSSNTATTAVVKAKPFDGSALGSEVTLWDLYANPVPGTEAITDLRSCKAPSLISLGGGQAEMVIQTDIDTDYTQSLVFFTGAFPGGGGGGGGGQRNRFY